jgi:hypothetical protein
LLYSREAGRTFRNLGCQEIPAFKAMNICSKLQNYLTYWTLETNIPFHRQKKGSEV